MSRAVPFLNSRLQGFGTTIFAEMSALAVSTGAINLGQGFPDTDGPDDIAQVAIDAIRGGHNQYPPGIGIPTCATRSRATSNASTGSTSTPTARCSSPRARPKASRRRSSRCAGPVTRS
jgi:N-succinyldiaminopimelate aminotransferase